MAKTLYEILEVRPGWSDEDIHRHYKSLALQFHPDKGGGNEARFKEITEAYAVLRDPAARAKYDATLRMFGGQCSRCGGSGQIARQISFTKVEQQTCKECGGSGQR